MKLHADAALSLQRDGSPCCRGGLVADEAADAAEVSDRTHLLEVAAVS